jgi:Protein of unknown function (DUF3187)
MIGRSAGMRWLAGLVLGMMMAAGADAQTQDGWQTLGLLRIRDMTPWGLTRLDFLPAHAFRSTPGTFAVELNMSYQNTWAQSGNVADFLDARGKKRAELSAADISAIFALGGDAYLVDGEYGLLDLTLHYRFSSHWGAYLTVPYFTFYGGFLDSTIEGFHDAFGLSNSGRDNVPRNRWQVIAKVDDAEFAYSSRPANSLGDPVVGLRYSLNDGPAKWNLVTELAVKVPRQDEKFMVSSGKPDYGIQMSLQRFFAHNAFYATASAVYFRSPDLRLAQDQWLPTLILGWETRVSQHLNFVLQTYASRSTVQETNLDELSAGKLQATGGLQWSYRGNVLRFGITENLANFNNTPDIGVTLSFVRVFVRS